MGRQKGKMTWVLGSSPRMTEKKNKEEIKTKKAKGEEMKRIFIFLIGVMMVIPSFAGPDDTDEICRRNTLVMAVLQKEKNGTVSYLKPEKKRWVVTFDYDIFAGMRPELGKDGVRDIYGSATCNGIAVKSSSDGKSNNAGDAEPGNTNTFLKASSRDVGPNCWCKMDWPVTSWWTYFKKYADKNECKENCTTYCANSFANNTEIASGVNGRDALFYTIW